jgi:alkylresorcinol/alkylpyrone synthase
LIVARKPPRSEQPRRPVVPAASASPGRLEPRVLALATAVPGNVVEQERARDFARAVFGDRIAGFGRLERVFASTGIERRYIVEPYEWYERAHNWPDRTDSYVAGACKLFEEVVRKALAAADLEARDIDTVITVSSTGVTTPGIEARMLPQLGFRSDVRRIPVFGLGCAGGVSGVALASRIAASEPGTTVLLVAIELCSLAFRSDRATKADIVSVALFGDGAAAALFRFQVEPGLATVRGATEHLWAKTLDIMGWSTDEAGLGVVLSRSLPAFIERNYRVEFERAMRRLALPVSHIDRMICHPGGTKVLEAIEAALGVPPNTLAVERSIMRDFGNMSSPTVLFTLERTLGEGFQGAAILSALGPGFTASFVSMHVGHA